MTYLSQCPSDDGCGKTFPTDLKNCPHCGLQEAFTHAAIVDGRLYGYDLETFPTCFTARFIHMATGQQWKFEISTRLDQTQEFINFIYALRDCGGKGVGFNNVGFDYPVIHYIMKTPGVTCEMIYQHAQKVINAMKGGDRFGFIVWDRDQLFPQIDLFKIHHFDNAARMTSLKALEFAMGMDSVEDLPFPVGTILTPEQMDVLHAYNEHDVIATCMFWARTVDMMVLREKLSAQYGKDFTNFNDAKIGSEIFIARLEQEGIPCFDKNHGQRRTPRQTWRPQIALKDVMVPYIQFEHPELKRIHHELQSRTITNTKSALNLSCEIRGINFDFGTGGLHGCVNNKIYKAGNGKVIQLRDVKSYYPNLSIKNKFYPAHLGVEFCETYEDLYNQRASYPKSAPENAALKLALNGTYGNSNNEHSPFYDPFFTMQITINGQLLLAMLAERLMMAPSLEMFNINTDGVAFIVDESELPYVDAVCDWWQALTCLELETDNVSAYYSADVNNYIMVHTSGDVKHKGRYVYKRGWHQDMSAMIVPKAAEAALVRGEDIETFIRNHTIDADFHMRAKVPRASSLIMRWPELEYDQELANIARYYVSVDGGYLFKKSPPKGVEGAWCRANKLTDEYYNAVVREISTGLEVHHIPEIKGEAVTGLGCTVGHWSESWYVLVDGEKVETDSTGVPHDPRIHTKNKSKYGERVTGISSGWRCTDCSDITNFDRLTINYDYYIKEAYKLVDPLVKG